MAAYDNCYDQAYDSFAYYYYDDDDSHNCYDFSCNYFFWTSSGTKISARWLKYSTVAEDARCQDRTMPDYT